MSARAFRVLFESEGTAVRSCLEVVARYLELVERRDLEAAAAYLAPGARLVFPGGAVYLSLREMASEAARRYRFVKKRVERWDLTPDEGGDVVVYCLGTLEGEGVDGRPFHGVRFVDRFVVRDGLIVLHEVWNDLAEHGLGRGSQPGR